jgi:hypothetical protein
MMEQKSCESWIVALMHEGSVTGRRGDYPLTCNPETNILMPV